MRLRGVSPLSKSDSHSVVKDGCGESQDCLAVGKLKRRQSPRSYRESEVYGL